MPVTERLRTAGTWDLQLRENTPKSILDDLDIATRGFGLLIITPSRVNPTSVSAAALRGMNRYVGVYRNRPTDYEMRGAHASILLGDEDGKGEILSAAVTNTAASLSTWMTALLPSNGIAKGTVSGGSTLTASYIYMSRRQAIDAVCDGCGADWLVRCNSAGDLVLDASPKATLFGSTAVALATRRALGGKDPAIASLRATQLSTAMDVEDYSTKIWLLARGDGGVTVGTATAGSVPYFGPGGAAIKMERIIDAPNVDPGNETTIAAVQLANFSTLRRAITLSTDEYEIAGVVRPGQNVYVYDPIINLYDNTVEQYFRGETIHPILMRCFGHTWPIRAGFGVYFQTPEASPRIVDLSPWFIPEDADTSVEVGALTRQVGAGPVALSSGMGDVPTSIASDVWTTYNPSWSGTIGNGTATAAWMRVGRTVHYRIKILWGSTTTHAAATQFVALPFVCHADYPDYSVMGQSTCLDAAVNVWIGGAYLNASSTSQLAIGAGVAVTGAATAGTVTNLVPMTWGTSDKLNIIGTYEASTS